MDLRRCLRYPQTLFKAQVDKFNNYHMSVPQVFYNDEDVWAIPKEKYGGDVIAMEPYPEAFGAYSHTGVGVTADDFEALAGSVAAVLVLAGEHTTFDYHGTVHGAFTAGRATANRIVDIKNV